VGPAVRALRERLLLDTLDVAVRAPFYRERLRDADVTALEDLRFLPPTGKGDLVRHGDAMRTSDEAPAVVALSSGTSLRDTVAAPAVCFRSRAELDAFAELREWRLSGQNDRSLIVNLITAVHGAPDSAPAPGVFPLPLEKAFHLVHLRDWLTRDFSFRGHSRRVHHLAGPLNLVRLLAVALEAGSPEVLPRLALRQVLTHGDHLSARWRTTIERILGAPVVNVYGISEVAGSTCHECPGCGYFHARPIVVPEVVSPSAPGEIVHKGRGELLLTALAPFQAYQPLIRYRTGDVVEVGPACPLVDDLGFRPVGRLTDRSAGTGWAALELPTFLVHELLDDEPDVAKVPYPRLADLGVGPVYGTPLYRLRPGEDGTAVLEVQLLYPARHFPERAAALEARLLGGLRSIAAGPVAPAVRFADAGAPLPVRPSTEKVS
jgi:phenylacetate-coenzyme A ligase PaaK-like adenylate-forming protein